MKKYFFIILCTASYWASVAQNTTADVQIITLKGDTLGGKLKNYPEGGWEYEPKDIVFVASNGRETVFTPKDIGGFLVVQFKRFYQSASVEMNNEPMDADKLKKLASPNDINKLTLDKADVFLSVLVKGAINLYEYYDKNKKYHYFISTKDKPIKELIYRKLIVETNSSSKLFTIETYKEQLSELMVDCPIKKGLSTLKYTKSDLMKMVANYNNYTGQATYALPKGESDTYWTPYVGFSMPILTAEEIALGKQSWVALPKPIIGVGRNWLLLRNNKRLSFGSDVFLLAGRIKSQKDYIRPNETIAANYKTAALKLNVSLIYRLSDNALKPYARIGVGGNLLLKSDFTFNYYNQGTDNGYRSYNTKKVDLLTSFAGIGVIKKNLLAELKIERGGQLSESLSLRANFITLYFGYVFKL
ncbi:MAG: hypothetical protein JNL70_11430 [Saprospiraceae bacterium]|nr:hypothetical protein [Saprospiraceae bacterium]